MYNDALEELGRLTIAFTWLDEMVNQLLKAVAGTGAGNWKRSYSVGGKLDKLGKAWRKHRDHPLSTSMDSWIQLARTLTSQRNNALKSTMFYGHAPVFPGVVKVENGKSELVNPKALRSLTYEIDKAVASASKLIVQIVAQIGSVDEIEDEESE